MHQVKQVLCPVCSNSKSSYFISTKALMHEPNKESYIFNKCLACESVFLANSVREENLNKYYTDNYLPYKGPAAWGKYRPFIESSQRKLDRKRLAVVSSVRNSKNNFNLLDVGCGNPSFLKLAEYELNAKCTGIDFSDSGWKNRAYDQLELLKTAIADFEPNHFFDVVTLWHYFEHDYHVQETVEKLYECLRPGGKLIIEVPDYRSISARVQKQFWQGWHSPRHMTLFSKKGFYALFAEDKWTITKYYRHGTLDAFTLWWLGKMEQKQINWSESMEREFWPLVIFKVISFPFFIFEKIFPMGIQLVIIEKK
ncbi:MAG: class I SAM-dependent methyltransferase [Mongoliibacter sp.]|uniref:class I SAM-dependent methyltransferase n=1 Tax=Mongoliibacter sp. TaxID=2022438 RepID=UPI0012F2D22F|nr:class I SAM-dependent methyltransferase [Mongoliibacter sp.]TVP43687.1 MAG: class I SAM-dependent methyltransferase [Mongoliibacter sp.]